MITFSPATPGTVSVTLDSVPRESFRHIIARIKGHRGRWDPETSQWYVAYDRYQELRSLLEDLDTVTIENEERIIDTQSVSELAVTTDRVIPDYSLLRYLPIEGKSPYEKYQHQDIVAGLTRNRYGYFIGMGGGKTYIMSALIAHYMLKYKTARKAVVVTTNIGVRNLYSEIPHFIKDLSKDDIMIADKSNRAPFYKDNPARVILMSYTSWRLVCNHYKKVCNKTASKPRKDFVPIGEWLDGDSGMLHLDESHNVANPKSQQGHLMALHAPVFRYRYLYSGTPADKPEKLYNQMKILDPALVHNLSYTNWLDRYANLGTRFSAYAIDGWKHDKLHELNQTFVAKYGVYRKSEDILDLPAHYEKRIFIPMSKPHFLIYRQFIEHTISSDQEHGHGTARDVINRFAYMMLALDNPQLLDKHLGKFPQRLASDIANFQPQHMRKLDAIDDIITDEIGEKKQKGILWVTHPVTAHILAEQYKKYDPLVIIGETPQDERNAMIAEFQSNPKRKLMIANITVLNTSVNITEATWQCYVERLWAYAPYEQSTKRIYRIGQTQPVTTYILIYDDSLDVMLDKNLQSKGTLVSRLLSKGFISQYEWKQIFSYNHDADDLEFEDSEDPIL